MAETELVMYTRTRGCPWVSLARSVLKQENVPYREVFIDQDPDARQRLLDWVGFLSVPTLIVAAPDSDFPIEAPSSLAHGTSPRGIDRGTMITEPNAEQCLAWLRRQGFVEA
jgi:glutaredoxin